MLLITSSQLQFISYKSYQGRGEGHVDSADT